MLAHLSNWSVRKGGVNAVTYPMEKLSQRD